MTEQRCIDFTRTYFDGETYRPEADRDRLGKQLVSVQTLMRDRHWRTLAEIAALVHAPEASVSARLRDLRKPRFGAWNVERRRRTEGTWEYRVGDGRVL